MAERQHPSGHSSRFHGLLITNLVFTDVRLGRGADATVFRVEWNGTVCAAKRLHEILLEDDSPGGTDKLIGNFEAECLTWSKLRHPGVVQFLGVYFERSSRLPVLIMEKMDISLRTYLEDHVKEQFPLNVKAFVLRQVTQALAYLHNQNPPLVHHDLSTNNVLLNLVSFVTKVSDFGMSRAINPSSLTRKSSIKGTLAFMAPEALQKVPKYDTKLDVFSFGNIIISTLTHDWPDPEAPNRYENDQLVALNEFQRREHCTELFTAQEKQLFLPVVHQCLENRPSKRPSSTVLVQELRRIESSLPVSGHVADPIEQLRQQLSAKEEECRQKDEVIKEKDEVIREKDEVIRVREEVIGGKVEKLRDKDEVLRVAMEKKGAVTRGKDVVLRKKEAERQYLQNIRKESDGTAPGMGKQLAVTEKEFELQRLSITMKEKDNSPPGIEKQLALAQTVKHPLRDWRKLGECQKVIQHSPWGGIRYLAVAMKSEDLLAVTDGLNSCVHLLTREGTLVRSIGKGVLGSCGGWLFGVAFDLKWNVWVTDYRNNRVVKLSQNGRLLQTIHHASSKSDNINHPTGMSVSPEGLIYICDRDNLRVTVHDEEGKFLFAFGSKGSGPGCFESLHDIAFGSDGLVYVTDGGSKRVCVWSKEGTFKRAFKPRYAPIYIATTSDNHLLITSNSSHVVMVYTLEGELVHEFGGKGSHTGRFDRPEGICVDDNGVVCVADSENHRMQVF